MVGSYSEVNWSLRNLIVRHDLPTPPLPTTTFEKKKENKRKGKRNKEKKKERKENKH